jgi:predicted ATPase
MLGSDLVVKIQRVELRNFRSFPGFDLDIAGDSLLFIGENGGGKSSLLTAMARAMGRDLSFARADFADPGQPIELRVVLNDLNAAQRGTFANYADFTGGLPSLTMETRSVWNAAAEEAETEHGFPRRPGSRSSRDERDGVPLQWLPAVRDATRMLQLGPNTNIMGRLLQSLPLQASLDTAIGEIQDAGARLAAEPSLAQLLADARDQLRSLIPDVDPQAFGLGVSAITTRDLLRQLELLITHLGQAVGVERQSSGISQLAVFAFAIMLARRDPGRILLVDEPEVSLHPQAQRALMTALRELDSQLIVATHSPGLLDRADPRSVIRLKRAGGVAAVARANTLSVTDAAKLARFTTPQAAEAFFARSVVLVEGISDQLAVEVIAERRGRNLDAEGVAIVPVGGASAFGVHHHLFGPRGLELNLVGLCDEGEERYVEKALESDGHPANLSRTDRAALGFQVCVVDLEDEFLRAIGDADTERLIQAHGDGIAFVNYQGQATNAGKSLHDQLHGFLHGRKVEYAPVLADAVPLTLVPAPVDDLLSRV